ncbi:SpaA isopeptide-forming pilin-related protein [Enterococcus sp. DIV0876]|uniref:SpaA isopeptide-forming pilin-related protein n=1 Tax=Enterococcus sp. DIV0876 TaxID=2774633 RepID=UPI003D30122A
MKAMKGSSIVGVIIIILQVFTSLLMIQPVHASTKSIHVLDHEAVKIDAQSTLAEDDAIVWKITYDLPEGELWLNITADQEISYLDQAGLTVAGDWLTSAESAEAQKGTLTLRTSKAAKKIDLQVKVKKTDPANAEKMVTLYETTRPISVKSQVKAMTQSQGEEHAQWDSGTSGSSSPQVVDSNDAVGETASSTSSVEMKDNQTPDSKKEDLSSEQTTATSKEPATNQKETTENSETTNESSTAKLPRIKARALTIVPASLTDNADPFNYHTAADGTYPNHHTNSYLNNQTSQNVMNYNFSDIFTEGASTAHNAYSSSQNFENGYHEYEDAYIKKIVMPTEDPNQFKIQLDVIGKALKTSQPVDIALVVDKSASMNQTLENNRSRWQIMKEAVGSFADSLLTTENNGSIRIGVASFGSAPNGRQHIPYAEVQKFTNGSAFTSDRTSLTNSSIISANSAPENSGTPTYFGVDAGYAMLTSTEYQARSNAVKVMIVLTDGDPTFAPNSNYNNLTNNILSLKATSTAALDTYSAIKGTTNYFTGDGTTGSIAASATATIAHMTKRFADDKNKNILTYSIGYASGTNDVLKKIGKDGAYLANNKNELITVLNRISSSFSASVQNATINDPMSTYVTLKADSAKVTALSVNDTRLSTIESSNANYPDYAKQTVLNQGTAGITLSNLYLAEKDNVHEGIRLTYTIELKEQYRDGLFYPANQTTYLENRQMNKSSNEYLHFAVPSIRTQATTRSLIVKKVWQDQENNYRLRREITLQLQEKNDSEWVDVSGKKLTISPSDSGEQLSTSFTNLPKYRNGQLIVYRVIEKADDQNRVPGYASPSYAPAETTSTTTTLEVTNRLLTTSVELTKVNEEKQPLSGATFAVYLQGSPDAVIQQRTSDIDGQLTFKDLPVGKYVIKEISAPEGYQKMADQLFEIVDTDGTLSIDGLPKEHQLINQRFLFAINLKKMNSDQSIPLPGAVFELSGQGISPIQATSNENGQITFATNVPAGVYQIKEITAPSGYRLAEGIWAIHIVNEKESYAIRPDGSRINLTSTLNEKESLFELQELLIDNALNDFHLKVTKIDQAGNFLAGASFRLTNHEDVDQTITSTNESTFDFQGLRPGSYELTETKTPDGFQGLKEPITIVIAEDGQVTIDNQIVAVEQQDAENLIVLKVSNHALPTLPQTGGIGVTPFIVGGLLLMFGAAVPWFYRKRRWR